MSRLPTVDDVARVAGVSRQTVSNVINAPEIVRETTRTRVQAAIDDLGYRPHASARRLRTRAAASIGVRLAPVADGISGSVFDRFLHALTERAARRDLRITLYTADDAADEIRQYARLRDEGDVDGFVVAGTTYDDERIAWLTAQRIPFVSFGRPWRTVEDPEHAWVDVDGADGVRQATEELVGRGLSRIGYLGWPAGSATGDDRRSGWAAVMRERFGLDADGVARLSLTADESVPAGRRVMERVLAEGPELDGLVCASDSLAVGALMAVNIAGLPRFPVMGFDNTPVAHAVGLSSVEQRLDLVAAATLELLMGSTGRRVLPLGGAGDDRHRLVAPELVVRRSSRLAPDDAAG